MNTLLEVLKRLKITNSLDADEALEQIEALAAGVASVPELKSQIAKLKDELEPLEAAQKIRVDSKIKSAIVNGLVKSGRRDALAAMDESELDAHLADLSAIKGTSKRPVPTSGDYRIDSLRAEMRTATPERVSEIARELRDLRGHKSLFSTTI
jgi:uncharacterized small protein (DUF1192 family)